MEHIPSTKSKEVNFLTFEESKKNRKDSINYDINKWMYYPNFYSEYRYILGTIGKNPIITIGINPSTAEPNSLDKTIAAVERRAHSNGYDSFIMFNVCAQRATNPNNMDILLNKKLHEENMEAFKFLLKDNKKPIHIWAAWGKNIEKREYLKICLKDIVSISTKYNVKWLKIGNLTKAGHPHHPLYLPKNLNFEEFDINNYINNMNLPK